MKEKILDLIKDTDPKGHARKIKPHQLLVDWLDQHYAGYSLATQIKMVRLGLSCPPVCQNCGGRLENIDKATCSRTCREQFKKKSGKLSEISARRTETNLKRYGVPNPASNSEVQQRRVNTLRENYGSGNSPKARQAAKDRAPALNAKMKDAMLARHGVENPGQMPNHREKCQNTMNANHGVTHWSKITQHQLQLNQAKVDNWIKRFPDTVSVTSIAPGIPGAPNDRISFTCRPCGNSETIPHETAKWRTANTGTPCSTCGDLKKGSAKEAAVAEWIQSHDVQILRNDRSILDGLELDIVIPERKMAIEFCGLYWHNDQRISKSYHKEKMKAAREAGYQLITLFEDEWDHRQSQVKHRLSSLLGLIDRSVPARLTQIVEVETPRARTFMEKYHISGYSRSTHKIGLEHQGELVAVMTFAKPNRSKGARSQESGVWEIARFATSCNVAGGASRLFCHFLKTHSPRTVYSYADLRWGQGGVYQYLGMTRVADTVPGYWYVSGDQRIHRFKLRKQPNEPKDITERELRRDQGYLRIWDCGHAKWIWHKEEPGINPGSE